MVKYTYFKKLSILLYNVTINIHKLIKFELSISITIMTKLTFSKKAKHKVT